MGTVVGPGIDERDLILSDDEGVGAMEREWSGVTRGDPPHTGRDPDRFAMA
jgi:hypothetical protein